MDEARGTATASDARLVVPSPPRPAPERPRRRWPWLLAVVLLTVVAAGGWGLAWFNYDRAEGLRETALELIAQRERLAGSLAETDQRLASTEAVLAEAEGELAERTEALEGARGEVADLEARLLTLANEKAVAEDEREFARDEAELMAAWAAAAAGVGAQLDDCIDRMHGWLGRTPNYWDSERVWSQWSDEADQVGTFCSDARAEFWDLQWLLDR